MRLLKFQYSGRVGHFLRAEMNASALSYPVPPRTALLGLFGNILGLPKDEPPRVLEGAKVAVGPPPCREEASYPPRRHYHKANVRKAFPAALPVWPRPARRDDTLPDATGLGSVSQVIQEWLLEPAFAVYVGAEQPVSWFADLERLLQEGRSHFTPCLGLAWMLGRVGRLKVGEAESLLPGTHRIATVCRRSVGQLDLLELAQAEKNAVQEIRMPRTVTPDRLFTHESYYLELNGHPLPVRTSEAGQAWAFGRR